MSVTIPESYGLFPEAPADLLEKIEYYKGRLLALGRLIVSDVDVGEARQTLEGVLRAQRDDLVRTTLALREPGRGA
ncbi:MAG TPA: hypothetical protein VK801_13035 [Caulobacteraceae bacterium]|jgi:hypothetical protein|nr:hypothetical protein [Caulobacteraceae bacterium]